MIKITVLPILNIIFGLFLLINNGYSLDNKTYIVQHNQEKIDLVYYDRFPYKKDYNGIKMPECIRASARKGQKTSDVLLCKEHITLLRPASVIKLWQRQQRLKGYIPFSMKEFGIINVHAHITGVKEYTQVMKNTITPDSNHVTGKFIRYAREVNRYTVKDKQTNMTSAVNATPNHPFYVINKHAFVPISKVSSSDSLVTLSNHEAHLIRSVSNNFPIKINSEKNKLTRVYNIETEKKHVYFISTLNVLVHNPYVKTGVKKVVTTSGRNKKKYAPGTFVPDRSLPPLVEEREELSAEASLPEKMGDLTLRDYPPKRRKANRIVPFKHRAKFTRELPVPPSRNDHEDLLAVIAPPGILKASNTTEYQRAIQEMKAMGLIDEKRLARDIPREQAIRIALAEISSLKRQIFLNKRRALMAGMEEMGRKFEQ